MADITFRVGEESILHFLTMMHDMADYCIAHHEEMAEWICSSRLVELSPVQRMAMRVNMKRFHDLLGEPEFRRVKETVIDTGIPIPLSLRQLAREIIHEMAEDEEEITNLLTEILDEAIREKGSSAYADGLGETARETLRKVNKVDLSDSDE